MMSLKLDLIIQELQWGNSMIEVKDAQRYVGGHWEFAGKIQLDLLIKEGLKPEHKLLEIGCGCFRAGRYFIEYLDKGNYHGVEQHIWLIESGYAEIINDIEVEKKPRVLINSNFAVSIFKQKFDYIIAKSVFTHLTKDKIEQCLNECYEVMKHNGAFYTSIFIGDSSKNLDESDDTKRFAYTIEEINKLDERWKIENIGHKGCGKQTMLKLTKI